MPAKDELGSICGHNGSERGKGGNGRVELRWGAATDIGRRRKRNEDAFLTAPAVFAVADGMGGHQRGDVAAAIAIRSLATLQEPPLLRSDLMDAIRLADDAIVEYVARNGGGPMGTTLCGLAVTNEGPTSSFLAFNVGDSRCYRIHGGDLEQISHDHSVVQELLDAGLIDASEAASHPERNVVTRSLGSGEPIDIDWWQIDPTTGDRYLLCSDGLVREVDLHQIADALGRDEDPQATAEHLVDHALAAGGRDNITVVVVDVEHLEPGGDLDDETNPRRPVEAGLDDDTNPIPQVGP